MEDINKDNFIKIIILCGLEILFIKLIVSGEVVNYVHPRIIPFIYFLIIGFLIMIIHMLKEFILKKNFKIRFRKYEVFILTLIFILFMNFSKINILDVSGKNASYNTAKADTSSIKENNSSAKTEESINTSYTNENELNVKKLNEVDGVIVIERSNFVSSLDEILNRPDKYDGREISISGFVYRDEDIRNDEIILGRYMMICCAADMQIAGIICKGNCEKLQDDTWIKVKGKISVDRDEPIINIENVEIDENPDKQYVYPFD